MLSSPLNEHYTVYSSSTDLCKRCHSHRSRVTYRILLLLLAAAS